MPILELLTWLLACSIVITIAAGKLHYHFALQRSGDLQHARRQQRTTIQISRITCLCLIGLVLYSVTP